MAKSKIAINGFGRIGRALLRTVLKNDLFDVVAINDLSDINTLVHLFKYDSVHGNLNLDLHVEGEFLIVNGRKIKFYSNENPKDLPWKEIEVDVVVEATGRL